MAFREEEVLASGKCSPSLPSMMQGSELSPTSAAAWSVRADTAEIQRLMLENVSLREAFTHANTKLSQLEDEKMRFFDEGIFDLVNSVCGHDITKDPKTMYPAGKVSTNGGPVGGAVSGKSPLRVDIGGGDREAVALRLADLVTSEDEVRSAQLRSQNEELRRELARASEVGEALEQQQQLAEDRMRQLEQEQLWLSERVARLIEARGSPTASARAAASPASPTASLGSCLPCGGSTSPATALAAAAAAAEARLAACAAAETAKRQELEEVVLQYECKLREAEAARAAEAAAVEAREAQRCLESEALEAARAQIEEQRQLRECRDRIIGDLDEQTQVLERKLRATEARARSLAEENARLQAALGAESGIPEPGGVWGLEPSVDERSPEAATGLEAPGTCGTGAEDPLDLEEAW